jgi:hypothetical protein
MRLHSQGHYQPRHKTLRHSTRLLGATLAVSLLAGCMSMESVNQFEKEWDQKHAPGTGIMGSRLGEAIKVLATYEATLEQRKIAEQRARDSVARMQRERQNQIAQAEKARAAQKPKKSAPQPSPTIAKKDDPLPPLPPPPSAPQFAPLELPPLPKRIAVEVPDSRKQGKSTVMLWDTASEQLVGNNVYDLSDKPAQGSQVALFSGAPAQYVGSGWR